MVEYVLFNDRDRCGYASFRNWNQALAYHDETVALQRQINGATVYRIDCYDGAAFIRNEITDEICNGAVTRRDRKAALAS